MQLDQPSAPYEIIEPQGEAITIDTSGKALIIPTCHPYILPRYNEYTLTPGRQLPPAGTYSLTNNFDSESGILNLIKRYIVIYDYQGHEIDIFLFTNIPKKLNFTVDGTGTVTQLVLYPGNGVIFHRRAQFPNLSSDADSDKIPDFLDPDHPGSIINFLLTYDAVDGTPGVKQFTTSDSKEFVTADGKYLFSRA